MISAVKISDARSRRGGFTLLEMMITLSLVTLLFTFVFVAYKPDSNSEKMRKATVELEALSARGHTMAMLHQKPFWLRFERNRVLLQGAELTQVDTSAPSDEFGASFEEEFEDANEVQSLIVDYDTFEFPEGMEVYVRRWGAAEQAWFHQKKPEDPVIFWNFAEGGLCEPISIKMEIENSWTELEMDPLTARVAEEFSEIYD